MASDESVAEAAGSHARSTRSRRVDFAARAQPGFRFSAHVLAYLAEHRVGDRPSIAGYGGRLWAPFLPLDLDAHPPAATLDDALVLARRVRDLLIERWRGPVAADRPSPIHQVAPLSR
jgi:hypothetical protein